MPTQVALDELRHQIDRLDDQIHDLIIERAALAGQVAHAKGYVPHGAISFQTQHYPDSPNHPAFPTTLLKPGEVKHSTTTFTFTTHAK